MEKLQKCVNFILTVPVFFATSCRYPKVMPTLFKLTIQVLSELALQRKMAPADDNKLSKNN
jgi:hypothetical protein